MTNRSLALATAELAEMIEGATSRGNVITVLPQPKPARVVPKKIGLKANGLDITWCTRKNRTPEERFLKTASDELRHKLKIERKMANGSAQRQ